MKKETIPIVQQNLFDIDLIERREKTKETPRHIENHIFDLIDALQSPILTFSTAWADTIPERIIQIIPMARMAALMKNEETATFAEASVYIYTRTLEAPMCSEWTSIYTHVSCQTLQDWLGEDRWDTIGASKELSPSLNAQLDRLRYHIYDKRRSILKARMKTKKKQFEASNQKQTPLPGPSQQLLF